LGSWLQLHICEDLCGFTRRALGFASVLCPFPWALPLWILLLCFFIASSRNRVSYFQKFLHSRDSFRLISFPFFSLSHYPVPFRSFLSTNWNWHLPIWKHRPTKWISSRISIFSWTWT
jgi:hypothetical protein